jgi:glycosyltransferase involved in cell wall biosynthesis
MHIVHYNLTTTTKEGGVETFVWELAAEQARRGHRVSIVSGRGRIHRDLPGVAVKTGPYLDRERFAIGPLRRAWALRKLAERLTLLPWGLRHLSGADLVHIHKPYDLVLAPFLRRRRIPLVMHGQGEGFFPGDRLLARGAAAFTSCSAYNAATLLQHYGREATVVYNGVDIEHFRGLPPEPDLRSRLLAGGHSLVLLPGRMMPWKGQQHAIEALARLSDPGVRLALVGDGTARPRLEEQVRAAGLGRQVAFTGTIPHRELPRYFAVADLALGTSFASETFGMVLAEAMACEKPVLASSWVGYDDVVIAGATGERFAAADPESLAGALRGMLADPVRRARYAAEGRRRVVELFAWSKIADRVEAVYERVRERPGTPR